ncbi:MAG TPA: hypothetical protein VMT61_06905 [Candidatus Binataceae bacterium]|nr:hypothetical protein [Candidatus Binataceae bacterium]
MLKSTMSAGLAFVGVGFEVCASHGPASAKDPMTNMHVQKASDARVVLAAETMLLRSWRRVTAI